MAASNDTIQESANPQTCCTNCQTVFEIPQELLASQDTRVRCGECLCIFDAMDGLSLPENAILPSSTSEPVEPKGSEDQAFTDLDVTYSDFDLFSEDADLPEVAYLDETGEPVELDFDSVEIDGDRTFSDTMFKHDVTINADIPIDATREPDAVKAPQNDQEASEKKEAAEAAESGNLTVEGLPADAKPSVIGMPQAKVRFDNDFTQGEKAQHEPLVFEYHDPVVKTADLGKAPAFDADDLENALAVDLPPPDLPPTTNDLSSNQIKSMVDSSAGSGRRWFIGSLMVLCLVALALGLYGYQERARLANDPRTRPVMAAACWALRCELPDRFSPDKLRVLGRHVYSHPDIADALVVNVVFRNEADYDQRYPVLIIKLSDISGKLVASRDFQPAEYLTREMLIESRLFAATTSLDISLEIRDPGANASSFEMDFR